MKSYKKLQKEFEEQVKVIQNKCKHKKTKIMEKYWAIGHSCGYNVKVCNFCNKELRKMVEK